MTDSIILKSQIIHFELSPPIRQRGRAPEKPVVGMGPWGYAGAGILRSLSWEWGRGDMRGEGS